MAIGRLWLTVLGLPLVGLFFPAGSIAHTTELLRSTRDRGLADSEVADVFSIGDITFVYRESELNSIQPVSPAKLQSVADAIRSGLPNDSRRDLINHTLELEHRYECSSASAEGLFERFFVWHITYQLFPTMGGFSGVPFQYRSYVRPDGTRVEPELYLCNEFELDVFEPESTLYSVLPFTQLREAEKEGKTNGEKVRSAATEALAACLKANNLKDAFRAVQTTHLSFPAKLVGGNDDDPPLTVWAVEFVESATPKEDELDVRSFRVWVREDLEVGTLSYGSWSTKAKDVP